MVEELATISEALGMREQGGTYICGVSEVLKVDGY